jgi:hypothetical protein
MDPSIIAGGHVFNTEKTLGTGIGGLVPRVESMGEDVRQGFMDQEIPNLLLCSRKRPYRTIWKTQGSEGRCQAEIESLGMDCK